LRKNATQFTPPEQILFTGFILLSILSIIILIDITSLTGFISSDSVWIAESCNRTLPPSTPCPQGIYGGCSNGLEQMVLTKRGDGLCCCLQLPDIKYSFQAG